MASMAEETLREAACAGDDATVRSLIAKGVPVNSQHAINKWYVLRFSGTPIRLRCHSARSITIPFCQDRAALGSTP